MSSNTKFGPHWKDVKSSYLVKQILELFRKFVTLTLGSNCVKDLGVTKIVKEIKFKGTWRKLEPKKNSPEATTEKLFEKNSSLQVK